MKALALLSGGLDSTLAVKLIIDQGIEVEAVNFTTPFCLCNRRGKCETATVSKKLGIPYKIINVGAEYLRIIKNPKHGYGKNMNPCIDCRIFMLKKAKTVAKQIDASFIFTGDVVEERPMSQRLHALRIIEKETGLTRKIVRPLSAKLLPETEAEKEGWIDRNKLLDIRGRSRKRQIELAKNFRIADYPCPSGGCLLTYKEFATKVRDLLKHKKRLTLKDIALIKVGRHFRRGKNKIVVGRNESENKQLTNLKGKSDYIFEVPDWGSPTTILQGPKTKKAIMDAASLAARYSDAEKGRVLVNYGRDSLENHLIVDKNE
ncbi:MAG: hypothetical protein ABIH76_00205 [Candidatus Bathyarchaeota archaeon]